MLDICIATYRTAKTDLDRLLNEIEALTPEEHAVHVFSNDENKLNLAMVKNDLAKSGARNYIAFLNPDVHLEPGWAKSLIEELESRKITSAVVPRGIVPPHMASENDDPLSFSAVVMRRRTWAALKGFDERFRFYGADSDFRHRIGVVERGDVVVSTKVSMVHSKGLPIKRAVMGGDFSNVNELNHRAAVRNMISDGSIKMWHELTDEEREAFRKNPAYLIGGPVIS